MKNGKSLQSNSNARAVSGLYIRDKESLEVDFKSFVSTMINKAYKMYPLNEYVILPIFPWIQTSFPAGKDINSILSLDEDGASLSIVA